MLRSLTGIPLFDGLDEADLRLLEPLFEPVSYPAGSLIFHQGDPAEFLYILGEGEVAIRYKPEDGEALTVTQVRPGGVFGWSAVVGSAAYTSGAIALTPIEAVRVHGRDLLALSRQYPRLGELLLSRLAALVSTRWQHAREQVQAILHNGLHNRRPQPVRPSGGKKMSFSTEEQLKGLIENLNAYIEHYHGGSVEFVSFDGKVLKVRLGGACLGCPLSPATLHGWVEGTVRQFFPDVSVEQA